jgi:hypothetical protein
MTNILNIPLKRSCELAGLLALLVIPASGQSWFFNWDGTTDITCVPTSEGNNAFFQGAAANSSFYWEIMDNDSGGKAWREVVTGGTGFRWYGYGSRPEFYRGPCTAFGMENLRADYNAFTITFRIKAETCSSTSSVRFFNCEFETTAASPWYNGTQREWATTGGSYGAFLGFRVEFALKKGSGDDIWLYDNRQGKDIYQLKGNGQPAQWHTVWATCELPVYPYTNPISRYRIWIDGTEVAWDDRDRNGWSDCEVGWTPTSGRYATFALDYLCYTYGAYAPNTIPIPPERALAATNSIAGIKACADGTPVSLTNKVVTFIGLDTTGMKTYFIAETNGADGIKVRHQTGISPKNVGGTAATLALGDIVSVEGGLSSAECEKQISAYEIVRTSAGAVLPAFAAIGISDIAKSYNAALMAANAPQIRTNLDQGTIGSLTTNSITDLTKNWTPNEWEYATLMIPAAGSHPDLYYHVITNGSSKLQISHRAIRTDFNNQPNLVADGVEAGQVYYFIGGRETGPRYDGRFVRTVGIVMATNTALGYFDINDGSVLDQARSLQDIWDTVNYGSVWTPPSGLRVRWNGLMPALGNMVSVKGMVDAERVKYQVSTSVDPANSVRDEVKLDRTYPVIAANAYNIFAQPVISYGAMTSTGFLGQVSVIAGEPYRIRASTDLQAWSDATNFVATVSSYEFVDHEALVQPRRFYQAVSP